MNTGEGRRVGEEDVRCGDLSRGGRLCRTVCIWRMWRWRRGGRRSCSGEPVRVDGEKGGGKDGPFRAEEHVALVEGCDVEVGD